MTPTQLKEAAQVQKLPKWAQERIRDLERERNEAIRALNRWVDDQTPSPFSIDAYLCTGEQAGPTLRTRYVQAHGMKVIHGGVELNILLRDRGDNGNSRICLQWNDPKRLCNRLAMIPVSFQSVELISKDNIE